MTYNPALADALHKKLEEPLLRLDPVFQAFSEKVGARLEINFKDQISRRLTVGGAYGLACTIQIGPGIKRGKSGDRKEDYEYLVGLLVTRDRNYKRYWWHSDYAVYAKLPNKREMQSVLQKAWKRLLRVKESDLVLA